MRQAVVDDDAAALADRQPGVAGQLVARPDAGGEHDQVGVELGAVGERQASCRAAGPASIAGGRRADVHA